MTNENSIDILESFEEFVWTYEVDFLGSEGLATKSEIADLYKDWLELRRNEGKSSRSEAAQTAAKTRAANAKKGISQKNLTGSTKQKRWASEIRGSMIKSFDVEVRDYVLENETPASFWIDYRNADASWLSKEIAKLIAAHEIAYAAYFVEVKKFPVGQEFIFTPELSALRDKSNEAFKKLDNFLSGRK